MQTTKRQIKDVWITERGYNVLSVVNTDLMVSLPYTYQCIHFFYWNTLTYWFFSSTAAPIFVCLYSYEFHYFRQNQILQKAVTRLLINPCTMCKQYYIAHWLLINPCTMCKQYYIAHWLLINPCTMCKQYYIAHWLLINPCTMCKQYYIAHWHALGNETRISHCSNTAFSTFSNPVTCWCK